MQGQAAASHQFRTVRCRPITESVARGSVVGRDGELRRVDAFLDAARTRFGALAIEGEAGIGKTQLWREAVGRARDRGVHTWVARATQSESGLAFAGLADLLDRLDDRDLQALPGPQAQALAVALLRAAATPGPIDGRPLFAAVISLLRRLAARGPVLVAVDDAQWLDAPSARVLAFAVRRLDPEPVGVLVTVRVPTAEATFDRFADPGRRQAVTLGALTIAALHEVIKQHTGRSLPRPVLVRIDQLCRGNPFYALQLADELHEAPVGATTLTLPASVMGLLEDRIGRLPATTQRALLIAATLSRPTTDLVDAQALEPAEGAGIVTVDQDLVRFSHPLFASAAYNRTPPSERRAVHRGLAEVVADAEQRARHLALGATVADAAIASELDAAARAARRRGAPEVAAELVELALQRSPPADSDQRVTRLQALAGFRFDAGDLANAEVALDEALAAQPPGVVRSQLLQMGGRLHARRSSFAAATEAVMEALNTAGDDPERRTDLELDLAYYWVSLGDFPRADVHAAAAMAAATRASPGARGDALAVSAMTGFLCGGGVDQRRLTEALELEEPDRERAWQNRPSFIVALIRLWTGQFEEALAALEGLRRRTQERGEESAVPILGLYLMWVHLWRGDLVASARAAADGREAAALIGDPGAEGSALSACAVVHAHDGTVEQARIEAAASIACLDRIGWRAGAIWALWALGVAELSVGDAEAADRALGPLAGAVRAMGAGDPVLGVFVPDEIEALVELGRLEEAAALLDWFQGRADAVERPWARAAAGRCRGLLQSAQRDQPAAVQSLHQALDAHAQVAMPFERARTLLVLGRILRRSGRRGEARRILTEAGAVFDRLGSPRWSEQVAAEMARLGSRAAAPDALTPTEDRIARLVASGLSNREVAERAFLTTKTVEANLTRVYRKLGVRSRSELLRALGAPPRAET
ncbi:MAG: helix-turn-helix transcriptional regulator [Acidimicrobiales bacterium]